MKPIKPFRLYRQEVELMYLGYELISVTRTHYVLGVPMWSTMGTAHA